MTIPEINTAIKARHEALGLRQNDLAELSGLTIKTIHLIESEQGTPHSKPSTSWPWYWAWNCYYR